MKLFHLLLILSVLAPLGLQANDKTTLNPATKTLIWPDGTRYVGGVNEGKRKGKGTIFWQDGTRFVGQFENDMCNGLGTMTLPDGTVYAGLFKNCEFIDTEPTIAARENPEAELHNQESAAALKDIALPMEADSIGDKPSPAFTQVNKNDLLEPVNGRKPTVVLANAPELEEKIFAAAKTSSNLIVQPESSPSTGKSSYSGNVTEITDSVKDDLIGTLDRWAAAWSGQNASDYIANYSEDFAAPDHQSRRNWEALRKKRILRPSNISLDIRYQRFELVKTDVVDVFFRQAYRSNTYSDLNDKVIRLRKEQKGWKILVERSM